MRTTRRAAFEGGSRLSRTPKRDRAQPHGCLRGHVACRATASRTWLARRAPAEWAVVPTTRAPTRLLDKPVSVQSPSTPCPRGLAASSLAESESERLRRAG